MVKKKFYAVAVGRSTGIFTDWATAEKQVKGFAAAKFKSFPTRAEAEAWLQSPVYVKKEQSTRQENRSAAPQQQCDPDAIIVYTDGGSINNPGPGGYGIVIERAGKRQEISGGFRHTTNNRMEMMAAIVGLRELQNCGKKVFLYSDSSYLVNGITKGWAKKWRSKGWKKGDGEPVLNIDLWKELLDLLDGVDVLFNWVKGHAGNELNERCDRLAVTAARQAEMVADVVYEATGNGGNFDQRTL
ncbi:MAG: ribonuclease HI [Desulforhopalus sp.]